MTKQFRNILILITALVTIVVALVIYRMFFQFNWKEIQGYIREEAAKYSDPRAAAEIITEGVENILSSHNLTQQALASARATKTDKEQELVNAAINQCISYNYLPGKATIVA